MDTPEIQEIIREVLHPSGGEGALKNFVGNSNTYGPRYAFKALVSGAPEVMDQLCGRLDVTGLYAALFVSAELALLMTNETPVSSDASRLVFTAGFAISLSAFISNILLVKAMHATRANLVRDADIIG